MDNSVYQPLSHALNPPTTDSRPAYAHPVQLQSTVDRNADHDAHADTGPHHEEEEEEDEVEGAVVSPARGDKRSTSNQGQASPPSRRRPGRPKGSKNKKPRFDMTAGSAQKQQFSSTPLYSYPQQQTHQQQQPDATSSQPTTAAPAQPGAVSQPAPSPYSAPDSSNQALYDFQWRVLSLCSEFYNAADELIRNAPQHVLHQCFSLPGNQVDPITLLHEARKACDQLMANPAAVVLKVPPQPVSQAPTTPAKSISPPAPVITNPGSFVMSLSGAAAAAQAPQQGAYNPGATYQNQPRYPTTPYYAYATPPTAGAHTYMAQQQVMKPVNLSTPSAAGNQGAWSDEETERLKQLAEESKTAGTSTESGEIDWDWVCNNWGPGRTRHQILIKATNLNLKESSSRATKKRRDTEPVHGVSTDHGNNGTVNHSPGINGIANAAVPNTSTQAVLNAVTAAAASSVSPPHERPASSSVSPVTVHPQQPAAPPAPPGGGNLMHWPVPSPSPVISSGTLASRSVYYPRDRNGSKA
ncbi:hypothetical protein ACEPAG_6945 [Sanghuangporus baumii]